ncbi:MAG: hypothetical protein R3B72_22165 [Polyangiaceae bacterium]
MSASRRLQIVLPALAAALSAAYLHLILRDGPRIIDATAYYLEAKVLASGALTLPVSGPPHATVGRFLVAAAGSRDAASVIFPPGYPALLALGFLVGAPLAVGPALAAVICGLTMDVTRQMARRLALPRPELVVALAGTLSATCAALRYHTADTMSHGLAAALLLASVACALRLAPRGSAEAAPLPALGLGLTLGALAATRPVTAIAVAIAAAPLLPDLRPRRHLVLAFLGLAPGLLLWLAYQHAATGSAVEHGPGSLLRPQRRTSRLLPLRLRRGDWLPRRARRLRAPQPP